jgi:hypothetical protein
MIRWVCLIGVMFIGFIMGWLFPVEGPVDYVYDDYVGNKTIQKPVVNVPAPETKKTLIYGVDAPDVEDIKEVLIDLNEDGEQEWYLFMPLLKK